MANLITPDAARAWLRVGSEVTDEALQPIIDAATQTVADFMGRSLDGEDGWADGEVPPPVIHAIKVVLVVMYDNRDAPVVDEKVLYGLVGRYCIQSFA